MTGSNGVHPPASGAVRVGVTGHRFLRDVDELVPLIDRGLDAILARWRATSLVVISPLAEGSDRLVAQRVILRPGGRLVVPMPMPEREYMQDFASDDSDREFLDLLSTAAQIVRFPAQASRPAAYEVANQYVLEHCDVLMALWDGGEALGEGGTGAMVAQARKLQRPLYWIWACNCLPGIPGRLDAKQQGRVRLEGF